MTAAAANGIAPQLRALAVPIGSLTPHPRNARMGDVGAISMSLARFGQLKAVVVQASTMQIVAGNHLWRAAKALGWQEIAANVVAMDDDTALAFLIADNRTADLGSYDEAALADILTELAEGGNLAGTGYTGDDIDELLADLDRDSTADTGAAAVDPDAVPAPPVVPITRPGDLWTLGDHRLLCGDSRDRDDVARLLGDDRIDLAFTSPPYASQRKYDPSTGFTPIPPDAYSAWYRDVAANIAAHLAVAGSYLLNIKEHCDDGERDLYVLDLVLAHKRQWGWKFIDTLCWQRIALPGVFGPRFKNEWEPVYHFARAVPKFYPQQVLVEPVYDDGSVYTDASRDLTMGPGYTGKVKATASTRGTVKSKHYAGALPGNVIVANKSKGVNHPAQFPVGLADFVLRAYSTDSDVVYDPFCGSGTVLVAAEALGRRGRAVEISPQYTDVILQRWADLTGKDPVRADGASWAALRRGEGGG